MRIGTMNLLNTSRHLHRVQNPFRGGYVYRNEVQRIPTRFPANFPAGNWQEIGRWCPSGGGSIDIATPKGVLELSRSARSDLWREGAFPNRPQQKLSDIPDEKSGHIRPNPTYGHRT